MKVLEVKKDGCSFFFVEKEAPTQPSLEVVSRASR